MKLILMEDTRYSKDIILNSLKKEGLNVDASYIWDELVRFFSELQSVISILRQYIYRDLEIESPVPYADNVKNEIYTGEWIGVYRIPSDFIKEGIEIQIEPKIGAKYFVQMLNEISGLKQMIGYNAINVAWVNTYGYSYIRDYICYSTLLEQLTELMFSEGIPPLAMRQELLLNDFAGHVNIAKTQKLLEMGIPLVVAVKKQIELPRLPLIIVTKFHLILQNMLLNLLSEIRSINHYSMKPIEQMIEDRIKYHSFVLLNDIVKPFISSAGLMNLEDREVLKEARKQAGKAKWIRDIVDLYESFMYKRPPLFDLFEEWKQKIPIQPLPTSKVYELWILSLLMKIFAKKIGKKPKMTQRDGGFEFDFEYAKIEFNIASREWSKIFSKVGHVPRPDFMLLNGGRRVVADAKYREIKRLQLEDLERMVAYILDYSEPQDHEEIKGFFITLGFDDKLELLTERKDTVPNVRIYRVNADPRSKEKALLGLRQIYQKFLS